MQGKLYFVIAEYFDPRLPCFRSGLEGFTEAADRAAFLRLDRNADFRLICICRSDGVVVSSTSAMPYGRA